MQTQKSRYAVIDTNVWLMACALSANEGPNNNSELDREMRCQHNIQVNRARGAILLAQQTQEIIIPKKVCEELHGLTQSRKLSPENKRNLHLLLEKFFEKETPTKIHRQDIQEQNNILAEIHARSQEARQNPNQLNVACAKLLERKEDLRSALENAEHALRSCPESDPLPYNETLDEIEDLNSRKKELTNTPEGAKAYLQALLTLEKKARQQRPYLLPDMEILLCAKEFKADVITHDTDLKALWHFSKDLREKIKCPYKIPSPNEAPSVAFCQFLNSLAPKKQEGTCPEMA